MRTFCGLLYACTSREQETSRKRLPLKKVGVYAQRQCTCHTHTSTHIYTQKQTLIYTHTCSSNGLGVALGPNPRPAKPKPPNGLAAFALVERGWGLLGPPVQPKQKTCCLFMMAHDGLFVYNGLLSVHDVPLAFWARVLNSTTCFWYQPRLVKTHPFILHEPRGCRVVKRQHTPRHFIPVSTNMHMHTSEDTDKHKTQTPHKYT